MMERKTNSLSRTSTPTPQTECRILSRTVSSNVDTTASCRQCRLECCITVRGLTVTNGSWQRAAHHSQPWRTRRLRSSSRVVSSSHSPRKAPLLLRKKENGRNKNNIKKKKWEGSGWWRQTKLMDVIKIDATQAHGQSNIGAE